MDEIGPIEGLQLSLWYLDDGTFIGTRESISSLLQSLVSKGPNFGLFLNLKKCEILWPSGDQVFPESALEVRRIHTSVHGAELLGSPIIGSEDFFIKYFSDRVDKVLEAQGILPDLENSKVELHLLRSCLSVCKINHLL